jgi:ribosome-associated heat shock protein Hsp15
MIRRSGGRLSGKLMFRENDRAPVDLMGGDDVPPAKGNRQRIDRWLWHARLVRTRDAAAALASSGHVRVNGTRIHAPGRMVRPGDVITVALERSVRVLRIMGFVERRGPAQVGKLLYEELT